MTSRNQQALRPGEIRLDYIPVDWPLTPLGANKDPYVSGWQGKPFSAREIEEELLGGKCKAVGLIGGPVYNHPYGLIWVDVDGPSVYKLVEELSELPIKEALPSTLTIFSGKEGRERKLYRIDREKHKHLVRNKYTWHAEADKEKLEILWKKHQGVLMGLHPETEGYYTGPDEGFEWVDDLPEFPAWILNEIIQKNVKQGVPSTEKVRYVGPNFAVQSEVSLERDIKLAVEATWALPPESADDYDIWITVGQALHSLDESLLDQWDEWSKQSDKYKEGECHKRWRSFSKGGGRGVGSLIHIAQEHGWKPSQNHKAMNVDDDQLDLAAKILAEIEPDLSMPQVQTEPQGMNSVRSILQKQATPKTGKGKGKDQRTRNPSSNVVTDVLLQMYSGNLLFSQPHGQFFLYEYKERGLWSSLTKVEVMGDIRQKMQQLCQSGENENPFLPNGFSSNLMNDIYAQLQSVLTFDDWYDGSEFLLFTNGVLNVNDKELLPFNRELYLTQQMPYSYDPYATCEEIIKWLKHTQHDSWERTQVLRAWLRATLLGRYEIQKFVEIVGPGKSGKSTYANLAVALVGKSNTYSTDFENMEKNRFEAAAYMGKKLLLFQDADRWGGSVSRLKAITGNDWIRSERKYQGEALDPFQYHGMVMITANEAIQSTDYTSGLARRRLTIPFDRPFTGGANEQKELIKFNSKGEPQGIFAPLLPGLLNWLLDMSEEEMREYLMETSKKVKFFKKYEKMQNLRSNPLLDWMEHKVVFDPGISAAVGFTKNAPMGSSHVYANQDKWLYASYAEFCRQCNVGVMSRNRFEPLFIDICTHQLKMNVYSKRSTRGMRVINAAVRESDQKYEGWPSIVEVSSDKEKYKEFYGMAVEAPTDEKIEVAENEL